MRSRLFKKFFFTTSAIILVSLMIMMVILTIVFNTYMAREEYESLGKTCYAVSDFAQTINQYSNNDSDEHKKSWYDLMNNIGYVSDSNIFITDEKGTIYVCRCDSWKEDRNCEHTGHEIPKDIIERSNKQRPLFELSTLGFYKNPYHIGILALGEGDKTEGYVVATSPLSHRYSFIKTIVRLYFVSALFPIVIMFFAIYAMTYRLTKPMKQMSQAAKAMAKGDFSRRIPVTSDDEIGELAASFNQMTNSLVQLEGMRRSFVANVSHELKTPMTTIAGFIDGIIDGTITPEKEEYYLDIVSTEIKRLSRLVQSMLEIAKLESGEFVLRFEKFDFRNLLLEVVISQEQRIEEKKLQIKGLDETEGVVLNADRDLIHQVVYNLVDNAVKFCDENGTIKFNLHCKQNRMIFNISNTGRGIPENALPLIFERFYKVDKSRSANKNSTGLGLHIAKTIVKSHGGTISVSSRENEFTAFEVSLPLSKKT